MNLIAPLAFCHVHGIINQLYEMLELFIGVVFGQAYADGNISQFGPFD
jgi:hypothetical protein